MKRRQLLAAAGAMAALPRTATAAEPLSGRPARIGWRTGQRPRGPALHEGAAAFQTLVPRSVLVRADRAIR